MGLIKRAIQFYYRNLHPYIATDHSARCVFCGWRGRAFDDFATGFDHVYKRSTCPGCGSQPRHRLLRLFMENLLDEERPVKLLHFAPEPSFTKFFETYSNIEYLSVDLDKTKAMRREDITDLTFADETFDMIFCSHVLEHIEDDHKAMTELVRVLKHDGLAIIHVPIDLYREDTYEDPSIDTPEARTKAYWQYDHLRLYGRDFPKKLEKAGFDVTIDEFVYALGERKIVTLGLEETPIYLCRPRDEAGNG